MLQRTKGRLLLTLLVISGLAGTLKNTSISKKERKYSINLMKDTKNDVMQTIKGLSEAQLSFKPSAESWSIKECMYHIAVSEKNLWDMLEGAMKAAANPEKRSEVKLADEQLVAMMQSRERKTKTFATFEPQNTGYKTMDEAINDFKTRRGDHIKYIKTTTEDLRNHVIQMPFGSLDCYQLSLMMAAHSERHRKQMEEIKSDPNFPK